MTTTIKIHARRSPSSSIRWTICHASYFRESQIMRAIRQSNHSADNGTVMHDLAEHCLRDGNDAYIETRRNRCVARVDEDGVVIYAPIGSAFTPGHDHEINDEICDAALRHVEFVRNLALGARQMLVEQRLSIEHITGEAGAKGTSDTILLYDDEIAVPDLKGGFDRVFASYPFEGDLFTYGPEELKTRAIFGEEIRFPNPQLVMYASAALEANPGPYKRVRLIISQPRLDHVDEYVMPIELFHVWVRWIREQSLACEQPNARAVPGQKQCQYCAAFPCAEATALAVETAVDDFEDKPREPARGSLGRLKRLVPYVRMWCDKVDAKVQAELTTGHEVDGWKLVQGDQGDREWTSEALAEYEFMRMGLDPSDYTVSKIVSPAAIEKLVLRKRRTPNKKLTQDQWDELQALVRRAPGGPKVVPDTDPRPKLIVDPTEGFDFEDDFSNPGDNADFF